MDWRNNKINTAIQVLPEAEGKLKFELVDEAIKTIQETGLKYEVCPFETVVECNFKELMLLLEKIHETCKIAGTERMLTNLKIQIDFNDKVSIEDKMEKYR